MRVDQDLLHRWRCDELRNVVVFEQRHEVRTQVAGEHPSEVMGSTGGNVRRPYHAIRYVFWGL